jgi:hypothetical protein
MSKYSCCGDVPYESLVKFMQKMSEVPANKKDKYIQQFMQMCVPRCTPDIFQIFRLLLPLVRRASRLLLHRPRRTCPVQQQQIGPCATSTADAQRHTITPMSQCSSSSSVLDGSVRLQQLQRQGLPHSQLDRTLYLLSSSVLELAKKTGWAAAAAAAAAAAEPALTPRCLPVICACPA